MNIVYLGSPKEAIIPLQYLWEHIQQTGDKIVAIVSQSPKLAGRSRNQNLQQTPVALWAKEKNILLFEPEKASHPDFLNDLKNLSPDLMITCCYGKILTEAFLSIPVHGTINIHPSLLPKYRGATPVPSALLAGEKITGLTIQYTVKALDAGPIVIQKEALIGENEDAAELMDRLFHLSGPMLLEALQRVQDPGFKPIEQNHEDASYCTKITKEQGLIDWNEPAFKIFCQFRAYQPWPGIYTFYNDKQIILEKVELFSKKDFPELSQVTAQLFYFDKKTKKILISSHTEDSYIIGVSQLKPAGGKSMDAVSFWNGYMKK